MDEVYLRKKKSNELVKRKKNWKLKDKKWNWVNAMALEKKREYFCSGWDEKKNSRVGG